MGAFKFNSSQGCRHYPNHSPKAMARTVGIARVRIPSLEGNHLFRYNNTIVPSIVNPLPCSSPIHYSHSLLLIYFQFSMCYRTKKPYFNSMALSLKRIHSSYASTCSCHHPCIHPCLYLHRRRHPHLHSMLP